MNIVIVMNGMAEISIIPSCVIMIKDIVKNHGIIIAAVVVILIDILNILEIVNTAKDVILPRGTPMDIVEGVDPAVVVMVAIVNQIMERVIILDPVIGRSIRLLVANILSKEVALGKSLTVKLILNLDTVEPILNQISRNRIPFLISLGIDS